MRSLIMRRGPLPVLLACAVLLSAAGAVWSQARGYRLRSDRVEIRTQSQWNAWSFPRDVVEISRSGRIEPKFSAAPIDAVADAAEFTYTLPPSLQAQYDNGTPVDRKLLVRGGIKKAGSNAAGASRAVDGDLQTSWEPDPADPLENRWIEIDLGRIVSATKVVLRFAEDSQTERADPFLQFRVLSATGLSPFGPQDKNGALDFVLVGGTTQPNREQRVFEFELNPLAKSSEGWTGRLVQYLRIQITDSSGDRAEQVSREAYQALDAADQGAVEYVWKIAGEERLVSSERYAALPPEQQGGVRHFRRERPKLAEVEIWSVGHNVALGLLDRGGRLNDINPNAFPEKAFDGSMRSEWFDLVFRTTGETARWGLLTIDLGTQFWIDAVRTVTRVLKSGGGENLLLGYLLRGSDGSRAPDGSLIWEDLSSEDRKFNQDRRLFEDRFAARKIRFMEFRNLDISRRTRAHLGDRVQSVVSEIQVFARGHPPEVVLRSDIIDLKGARNLTTITWDAETPPGTSVEIRTRTGDELLEVSHYFKSNGNEVKTREDYENLPSFFRGDIVTEILPGPGWSNFSRAYEQPGEVVLSPSPRKFMIIQAELLSDDPQVAASLRSIAVRFTAPFVERVVAELIPRREVPVGEPADFDLFIRPSYSRRNPGIDRIRLLAPSRTAIALGQVSLGGEAEFEAGGTEDFLRRGKGRFENAAGQQLAVTGEGTDSLQIKLPEVLRRGGPELMRLSFEARIFQSGSTFQVEVGNSATPENWQRVDPGDAVGDALGTGVGLSVPASVSGDKVKVIEVSPRIFTPNGDGINDRTVFEFAVLKVNVEREVMVELFDLSGSRVRRLAETRNLANGLYRLSWDGRDEEGALVPPGLYLVKIQVDSDTGTNDVALRTVGVVY